MVVTYEEVGGTVAQQGEAVVDEVTIGILHEMVPRHAARNGWCRHQRSEAGGQQYQQQRGSAQVGHAHPLPRLGDKVSLASS